MLCCPQSAIVDRYFLSTYTPKGNRNFTARRQINKKTRIVKTNTRNIVACVQKLSKPSNLFISLAFRKLKKEIFKADIPICMYKVERDPTRDGPSTMWTNDIKDIALIAARRRRELLNN